jgi:hypothetical protein
MEIDVQKLMHANQLVHKQPKRCLGPQKIYLKCMAEAILYQSFQSTSWSAL